MRGASCIFFNYRHTLADDAHETASILQWYVNFSIYHFSPSSLLHLVHVLHAHVSPARPTATTPLHAHDDAGATAVHDHWGYGTFGSEQEGDEEPW